jgi:ChrR-like protein with cupin domain
MTTRFAQVLFLSALAAMFAVGASRAADLDPKAVTYIPLDKIQWKENAAGTNANAMLYGDLSKPGPYAYFVKWKEGNMSRPHFHPNDRFIAVLSGTWWVGTGPKFDPDATVPMPAGTYVVHYGKGIHYDGAKQGDAILLIHGLGPAISTPAEQK